MNIDANARTGDRITSAIEFLQENQERRPDLNEVADYVGMSATHFQRVFKRWVGVSPKQFQQFLTIEHAKDLLDDQKSVLDVTLESGLSSQGRLHDLFVTIESVTPGEYKSMGKGVVIEYGKHETPFGDCLLAMTDRGVCGLTFLYSNTCNNALANLQSRWQYADFRKNRDRTGCFVGKIFGEVFPRNGSEKIELFLKGTNFQIQVWKALLQIPEGTAICYSALAKLLCCPEAVRAVSRAVGQNPLGYLIPCHRVIRKIGNIGAYRWGTARKKAMLTEEFRRKPA